MADGAPVEAARPRASAALSLHAVVRSGRMDRALDAVYKWRWTRAPRARLITGGELAVAISEPGATGRGAVRQHAEVVDRLLRRSTVVPLPFGVVARDADAVQSFLESQRIPLLEALDFFEDCFEFRLHVGEIGGGLGAVRSVRDAGGQVYESARRHARAARILSGDSGAVIPGGSALVAAFLIHRSEGFRLEEEVRAGEDRHPGVRFRLTGPWAPWDFVRIAAPEAKPDGIEQAEPREATAASARAGAAGTPAQTEPGFPVEPGRAVGGAPDASPREPGVSLHGGGERRRARGAPGHAPAAHGERGAP